MTDLTADRPLTQAEQAEEDRLHEIAEEAKWEAVHGGTDGDSDRAADAYQAYLDRMGGGQ